MGTQDGDAGWGRRMGTTQQRLHTGTHMAKRVTSSGAATWLLPARRAVPALCQGCAERAERRGGLLRREARAQHDCT
eukprot:3877257-Prymnesium_polylepis.1